MRTILALALVLLVSGCVTAQERAQRACGVNGLWCQEQYLAQDAAGRWCMENGERPQSGTFAHCKLGWLQASAARSVATQSQAQYLGAMSQSLMQAGAPRYQDPPPAIHQDLHRMQPRGFTCREVHGTVQCN